jgi:hypothetical protein
VGGRDGRKREGVAPTKRRRRTCGINELMLFLEKSHLKKPEKMFSGGKRGRGPPIVVHN